MTAAAERMKAMRQRRKAQGLRELRLTIPDARNSAFRRKIAAEVARLDPADEEAALAWIESVSEFDEGDAPRRPGHRRNSRRPRQASARGHRAK